MACDTDVIWAAGFVLLPIIGIGSMCWDMLAQGRHERAMRRQQLDLTSLRAENDRLRAELTRANVETRP